MSDKSVIGMPDVSITSGGTTQWVEVKLVKVGKRKRTFDLKKIVGFGGPQYRLMGQLDLQGRAYYIIFFTDTKDWWMLMEGAVEVANWCNREVQLSLPENLLVPGVDIPSIISNQFGSEGNFAPPDFLKPIFGKSFEAILSKLKEDMIGNRL